MESTIAKVDEDRRLVFGWASVSLAKDGSLVEDREGDTIDPRDLEDAAYEFVLEFGEANVAHSGPTVGRLVESFVSTPDKLAGMGLAADALPVGWWAGWRIDDDDAWAGVKDGRYQAFSIEGRAERVPVDG
jgi:hypothetical protein